MLELVVDTNDSTLLGSSSGYNLTSEVLNKYKISYNNTIAKIEKIKACKKTPNCLKYMKLDYSELMNDIYQFSFYEPDGKSLN